jgi:2,3-bisphosphoglycerate-dependent phosphoglycerate mutase
MEQRWPATLWIVRHGQSGSASAELRDLEVPLSPLGEGQATALGRWFAAMPADRRPSVALCSPFRRARQTAERIAEAGGLAHPDLEIRADERLRERDRGLLDGLTAAGFQERYPEQASLRQRLGEFYFRPAGGESWCDLLLRLRTLLDTLCLHHAGEHVLLVTHESSVVAARYLLEELGEDEILTLERCHEVAHCSVTSYTPDPASSGPMELERFNFVAPLMDAGTPVTRRPDPAPVR